MNPIVVRIVAVITFAAACFYGGWRVKAAFVAEAELASKEARDEMINTIRAEEGRVAAVVEEKLKDLRANERVLEREKIKIIDRPVYHNECVDADGLRLIETARAGRADPAKPADQVPGAK